MTKLSLSLSLFITNCRDDLKHNDEDEVLAWPGELAWRGGDAEIDDEASCQRNKEFRPFLYFLAEAGAKMKDDRSESLIINLPGER